MLKLQIFRTKRKKVFALLRVGGDAVIFDGDTGEPVAVVETDVKGDLSNSTVFVVAHFFSAKDEISDAIPDLTAAVATAVTVRPSGIQAALLFRDRASNSKLHQSFATMPFGAAANFERGADGYISFAQIATNVEAMRAVLVEHEEGDTEREARLDEYRTAVEGFGTLLRLAGAPVLNLNDSST